MMQLKNFWFRPKTMVHILCLWAFFSVYGQAQSLKTLNFASTGNESFLLVNTDSSVRTFSLDITGAQVPNTGLAQFNNPVFSPENALMGDLVLDEAFENGFPSGWTTLDNGTVNFDPEWVLASEAGEGNYAGTGEAAYAFLDNQYDFELRTPSLDIQGRERLFLSFLVNLRVNQGVGNPGTMVVDISTNGGSTWTNLWSSMGRNLGEFQSGPGIKVLLDMSAFTQGAENLIIRWRNTNPASMFVTDSYAQLDDIQLFEQDWAVPRVKSFSLNPGESQAILLDFSSHYLEAGTYQANLVTQSDAPGSPPVDVSLQLTVRAQGKIEISPSQLQAQVPEGSVQNQTLSLSNTGGSPLTFSLNEPVPTAPGTENFERFDLGPIPLPDPICSTCSERENDWVVSNNWLADNTRPRSGDKHLRAQGNGSAISPFVEVPGLESRDMFTSLDVQFFGEEDQWLFEAFLFDGPETQILTLIKDAQGVWEVLVGNIGTSQPNERFTLDFETPDRYFNIRFDYIDAEDLIKVFLDNREVFQTGAALNFDQLRIRNTGSKPNAGLDVDNAYIARTPFPSPRFYVGFPTFGTIAPGTSQNLSITFDPADLALGNYTNTLLLESNDPDFPSVSVPLSLEIVASTTNFTFVSSTFDQDLVTLSNGSQVNLLEYPSQKFTVRFDPEGNNFKSVQFEVSGQQSFSTMNNNVPFALFGDNQGNYYPWTDIEPGMYTITATPYTGFDATGTPGEARSVSFEIVEVFAPVLQFVVIDPSDGTVLTTLADQQVLDLNQLGVSEIAIEAQATPDVSSVSFALSGEETRNQAGTTAPFLLFGQKSNGDTRPWEPSLGDYTLQAQAFSNTFERGETGDPFSIEFSIENNVSLSYQFVDVNADVPRGPITDGAVIDLTVLGTSSLDIEAVPSNLVGSIRFELSGPLNQTGLENISPYALFGDNQGDFTGATFLPGTYTLLTQVYSDGFETGVLLTQETITFELIQTSDPCEDTPFTRLNDFISGKLVNGVAFSIGDKGYLGLGAGDNNQATTSYWQYEPATDTWSQIADFGGQAREDAAAFVIDGTAYVGLGINDDAGTTYFTDLWAYNFINNTWTPRADFPSNPRAGTFTFSYNGIGYVGGGQTFGGNEVEDMYAYNPQTDSWSQRTTYPGAGGSNPAFFQIGDFGYVQGGGSLGIGSTNELWQYNFAQNTWTAKADHPKAEGLSTHIGFAIGGKGYVGLGFDGSIPFNNQFWEYDPVADTWALLGEFCGEPVRALAGFVIGNSAYFGTGLDDAPGLVFRDDLWKFTPAPSQELTYEFTMYDTEYDTLIGPLVEGQVIDLNETGSLLYGIEVTPSGPITGSLKMIWEARNPITQNLFSQEFYIDNEAPFSVFAEFSPGLGRSHLLIGENTFKIIPFSQANAEGQAGDTATIQFTVLPVQAPISVVGFRLINADTDEVIQEFTGNTDLDITAFQNTPLTFEVVTDPVVIGTVAIGIFGPGIQRFVEDDVAPYSLIDNSGDDFFGQVLLPGSYTMLATPFGGPLSSGVSGDEVRVDFNLVVNPSGDASQAASINLFPNPAQEASYLSLELDKAGEYQVDLLTLNGELVKTFTLQVELNQEQTPVRIPLEGLDTDKMFMIRVSSDEGSFMKRVVR